VAPLIPWELADPDFTVSRDMSDELIQIAFTFFQLTVALEISLCTPYVHACTRDETERNLC